MLLLSVALATCVSLVFADPLESKTLQAAAVVTGNGITGHLSFTGYLNGQPSTVSVVSFTGLFDNANSPYLHAFHTNPIAPDGNCDSAFGVLDPMNVTQSLVCDPDFPQYCQQGDMSGKYGPLSGTSSGVVSAFSFPSNLVRFFPQDFSILGRSIVISAANKTRLACGNITSVLDGTADADLNPTLKPSTVTTNYPTAPPFNPAVVAMPFVGNQTPTRAQLLNMTFPLPNPLIPISNKTVYVELKMAKREAYFDNKEAIVTLPTEFVTPPYKLPFEGNWW